MLNKILTEGVLLHYDAIVGIRANFGEPFLRINDNDNVVLRSEITEAFKQLTPKTVVWLERPVRKWRLREDGDEPGRKQSGERSSGTYESLDADFSQADDMVNQLLSQTDSDIKELLSNRQGPELPEWEPDADLFLQ